jgi:hypothetical protein
MGDPSHQAILDVEVGERGLPEVIPPNAGPIDNAAPRITRIRFTGKRLRFRLSEKTISFKAVGRLRTAASGHRRVSIRAHGYGPGRASLPFKLGEGRWHVKIRARDAAGNRTRVRRTVRID